MDPELEKLTESALSDVERVLKEGRELADQWFPADKYPQSRGKILALCYTINVLEGVHRGSTTTWEHIAAQLNKDIERLTTQNERLEKQNDVWARTCEALMDKYEVAADE